MIDPRLGAAVALGRAVKIASRALHIGGGTTLPGTLAARLDPAILQKLSRRLARGSVVVTGTNGKTTTSRLISSIAEKAGLHPLHNRAGANLLGGVTTATLSAASPFGAIGGDLGLFEVDEAVMPEVTRQVAPRVVIITNLFRDQLDRYGEVDYLATLWRAALKDLPESSTIVLNADDPLVASLGAGPRAKVLYYGLEDESLGKAELDHAADSKGCTSCGAPLEYSTVFYGHVGHYRCPNCGKSRPTPDIRIEGAKLDGVRGATLTLGRGERRLDIKLALPGIYNLYNALAAAAVAHALGLADSAIVAGIESFTAAFGRVERIQLEGKQAFLALVKNPVGFNQVIRTVFPPESNPGSLDKDQRTLIIINDHFADGTDVSWLWDVDFELLVGRVGPTVVSGTRAEDMLLRLKYAGVPTDSIVIIKDIEAALRYSLDQTPQGETLYLFPTYTAMLEARSVLVRWGAVENFWEN